MDTSLCFAADVQLAPKLWNELVKYQAGYECESCHGASKAKRLCAHHIDLNDQNNCLSNGACLCTSCHIAMHREIGQWSPDNSVSETPAKIWATRRTNGTDKQPHAVANLGR